MKILDESVAKQLTDILADVDKTTNIIFFTKENCANCEETQLFLEELSSLNKSIEVQVYDIDKQPEMAEKFEIAQIPAIAITGEEKLPNGVKFYGPPMGYEIHSLISAIKEVGGKKDRYSEMLLDRITAIDKDIHIQVFVTPSCPHCPGAVITGHKLAMENDRITTDMVEASMFPALAEKYSVRGVPKIIINEKYELVGNQPVTKFLELIDTI